MTAPTAMATTPWRNDIARGGMSHESALVNLATALLALNFVVLGMPAMFWPPGGFPSTDNSSSPSAELLISIFGNRPGTSTVSGIQWDMSAQAVVPPFRQMTYLFLANAIVGFPIPRWPVVAAVPTPLNQPQQWSPSPIEALINALNMGPGYAIIGYGVVTTAAAPWTPSTGPNGAPGVNIYMYDGFPGAMLLPGASPGTLPDTMTANL